MLSVARHSIGRLFSKQAICRCAARSLSVTSPVNMDITKSNFNELLPLFAEKLGQCDYFAIDAEMTGLSLSSRKDNVLDSAEDRYSKLKESAKHFLIMQFGVSMFKWLDPSQSYEASTFNFYVFPLPFGRFDLRFTCQSASLTFLRKHKFDFNKFIYEGIPFLSLEQISKEEQRLSRIVEFPRDPILLTQADDVAFIEKELSRVRTWIEPFQRGEDGPERTISLSPSNSYRRLALRQALTKEFGSLSFLVERAEDASGVLLKLTLCSPEEAKEAADAQRAADQGEFLESCGFGRAVQLLVDSGKPMVGHNMAYDLLFFCQQFVGELPGNFPEFQAHVRKLFPGGVYDTKHLANLYPSSFADSGTSLEPLYRTLTSGALRIGKKSPEEPIPVEVPPVVHADGFERYRDLQGTEKSMAHEAGYDAFMTGACFAGLLELAETSNMAAEGTETKGTRPRFGTVAGNKNKVHLMFSDMNFLPLEGVPPVPNRSNVFLLSDFPSDLKQQGIAKLFADLGFGDVRLTWVDQKSTYVTVIDRSLVVDVPGKVMQSGFQGTCLPFSEVAKSSDVGSPSAKRIRGQ